MIKTVIITNYRGESLTLDLANPYSSGYAVLSITGLGPNKATINTDDATTSDGSVYNSARVNSRNIVLKLKLIGSDAEEIEKLRQKTYRFFPLKKSLTFEIITDQRHARILGYTESNEPNIFSDEETAQISIVCPYPFFSRVDMGNSVMFYGEEPLFEFPFENEGSEPVIEFGAVHQVTEANVNYSGDKETGIVITIHALGEAKNVSVFNLDTNESMKINGTLLTGDDIVISTVKNSKYVRLLRDGMYSNILNRVDKNPDWFELRKGDNLFAYTAEEGIRNLEFQIGFDILYEGI